MLSKEHTSLALSRQRSIWGKESKTEFVTGVIHGLKIAEESVMKMRIVDRHAPPEATKKTWSAKQFRRVIHRSMEYLKGGYRSKCLEMLQAAVEHRAKP